MSLLGNLAKKAVVHVVKEKATDVAMKTAVNKYNEVVYEKKQEEKEMLFENPSKQQLFLRENESWKKGYDIFDRGYNPKYVVKAGVLAKKHLSLSHVDGKEIGYVQADMFTKNTVIIYLNNKQLGTIKPIQSGVNGRSWKKLYYIVSCNGWQIEKNITGTDYSVTKGENIVFTIKKSSDITHNNYIVDISDEENEIVGLLIVLAMEAMKRL